MATIYVSPEGNYECEESIHEVQWALRCKHKVCPKCKKVEKKTGISGFQVMMDEGLYGESKEI